MKISPKAFQVLKALQKHSEGGIREDVSGNKWKDIYLDNARPDGMSPRSFSGYLSALEAAGLYISYGDDCFGQVRIQEN